MDAPTATTPERTGASRHVGRGAASGSSVDPFGLAALVGAGTIAAHELGYLVGSESDAGLVSHDHLALLGPLALLALVGAGWSAAIRVLRAGGGRPPRVALLAGLQIVAYAALEVSERIVVGELDTLASPAVLLGLVLQPVIAWLAITLLAVGRSVLVAIARPRSRRPVAALSSVPVPVPVLLPVAVGGRGRPRGPPSR